MSIEIFDYEREDGIALLVQSNASFGHKSQVAPHRKRESDKSIVRASEYKYDYTLYPIDTILVSNNENKNTDYFDTAEMTNEDTLVSTRNKQINFEHNEKVIIGHSISSTLVDENYEPIAPDTKVEDFPDVVHIMDHSVIYAIWQDEEFQELMDTTFEEIAKGEWFVSMECYFGGFDYLVTFPDGQRVVVARNAESAFLTKHLRQYGGTGVYVDKATATEYKLARFLKKITFSGKGLVRKPANPDSVILNEEKATSEEILPQVVEAPEDLGYVVDEVTCGYTTTTPEIITMPEVSPDVKLLQDRVAALETENKALATQLTEASVQAAQAKVTDLEADVKAKATEITQLQTQLDATKETVATLTKRVEEADAAKASVEEELTKVKASQQTAERVAMLIGKGAEQVKAEELVKKFENLTAAQFTDMVEVLSAAFKKKDDKKDDEDADANKDGKPCADDMDDDAEGKGKKGKAADVAKVIDNATPVTEPALSTAAETTPSERTAASAYIGNFLKFSTKATSKAK